MTWELPRPEDHLPLSPRLFHVLLALGRETLHGYGIIQAFEAQTDGKETLLPGSLYSTLGRMVEAGMLEEVAPPPGETSGGPPRRYYRATAYGISVAQAESERMERLLVLARAKRMASGGTGG
jgi:DNA-binding PadR family transcriptional regulator